MTLPPPNSFGAPERFTRWRNGQDRAFASLMTDQKKFAVLALPTGVGKSLVGTTYATLMDDRAAILTSTKGLQDQYVRDFPELVTDVRGMRNYLCRINEPHMCDEGPCLEGEQCSYRNEGCFYYDAVARARSASMTVTNYAFWMTQAGIGLGLGRRGVLILDEAHEIPEELTGFLRVDVNALTCPVEIRLPRNPDLLSIPEWRQWALKEHGRLNMALPDMAPGREARQVREQVAGLARLAGSHGEWVAEPSKHGWSFEPLWPSDYTDPWLWGQVPRVVLMSATIRPHVLARLGLFPSDYTWIECDSPFPVDRRPIIHVPTIRVNWQTSPENFTYLVRRMDNIISGRLDRKGIIHTVSYARAQAVVAQSHYSGIMFVHGSQDAKATIRAFKEAPPPAVLVSPTVHTGWDFPYELARYQVLLKVPFPDTRSGVAKARAEADKKYVIQQAAVKLVQAAGRVVRAEDDLGETFILDDNIKWVLGANREYFPRWFLSAYRSTDVIPPAMQL